MAKEILTDREQAAGWANGGRRCVLAPCGDGGVVQRPLPAA